MKPWSFRKPENNEKHFFMDHYASGLFSAASVRSASIRPGKRTLIRYAAQEPGDRRQTVRHFALTESGDARVALLGEARKPASSCVILGGR
ncbi:MAG TPA: hypothetical protein VK855_03505 [Thioalkalivibrio sp.]|nr:hypothetical protein [Thioalkalivibrio sp.]